MSSKVRRVSAAEAVRKNLVKRIRDGEFGPGDPLPSERELQDRLGVGRLSLREGLAGLSALGIIQVDHGRGGYVRESVDHDAVANAMVPLFPERDAKALTDLLDARRLVEGELTALAAAKRTEDDLSRLRLILDEPGDALTNEEAMADLDYAFHREISRIADNQFLDVILDALRYHIRAFLSHYARSQNKNPAGVIERHRPVLTAIEARDPEAARKAAQEHITGCRKAVTEFMKREIPHGAFRTLGYGRPGE